MFAVVFEVHPAPGQTSEYLELAQHLRPLVEQINGFISVERFRSHQRDGWMLSLSFWRDEKSLVRWRTQAEHHAVQARGRRSVFSDYRLRVCEITFDSGSMAPLPLIQQRLDETEAGEAKALGITEWSGPAITALLQDGVPGLIGQEIFESVYNPGKMVLLSAWASLEQAAGWKPEARADVRHRGMRVIRHYGMADRREAPQYFPDARPRVNA